MKPFGYFIKLFGCFMKPFDCFIKPSTYFIKNFGCFIKQVEGFMILSWRCEFDGANLFVLGACGSEYGFDVFFYFLCYVVKSCVFFV